MSLCDATIVNETKIEHYYRAFREMDEMERMYIMSSNIAVEEYVM